MGPAMANGVVRIYRCGDKNAIHLVSGLPGALSAVGAGTAMPLPQNLARISIPLNILL